MIPDDKKEQVRQAADIVEVVGDIVRLKRSGQSFTGLCPFHNEKTPSFNVNPNLGIFKCFGCGEGGDVFSFVMKTEGIGFTEAIRTLAERYNIDLPEEDDTPMQREDATLVEGIYHALRFAGLYYHRQLQESEEASQAREYLEKRGYSWQWIRKFGLGYAPSDGQSLVNEAQKEGINERFLLEADLIKSDEGGRREFDTFRGRLMFPIFNPSGRLIAFAGRILTQAKTAKYINSAQTKVYNKSAIVYGIHYARNEIRRLDEVLLVEGYTDVMTLHTAGVSNVVASSGTALTPDQIRLLKRYTQRLVMLYDADQAGQNAMQRGLSIALEEGMDVEMLELPDKEDPDSFIRAQGAEAFHRHKKAATMDFISFILHKAQLEGRLERMADRTRVVEELLSAISLIPDEIRRQVAIQQLHLKTHRFRGGSDRELYEKVERLIRDRVERADRRGRFASQTAKADSASQESSRPDGSRATSPVDPSKNPTSTVLDASLEGNLSGSPLPVFAPSPDDVDSPALSLGQIPVPPHPGESPEQGPIRQRNASSQPIDRTPDSPPGSSSSGGTAHLSGTPPPSPPKPPSGPSSGTVSGSVSGSVSGATSSPTLSPSPSMGKKPEYEKAVIRLMLLHGEKIIRYIGHQVSADWFEHQDLRTFYQDIIERVKEGKSVAIHDYTTREQPFPEWTADILLERYTLSQRHPLASGERKEDVDSVQQVKTALKPLLLHYLKRKRAECSHRLSIGSVPIPSTEPSTPQADPMAPPSGTLSEADRRDLFSVMAQIQAQISELEKTPADRFFPDPKGYREELANMSRTFHYERKRSNNT